MLKKNIYNYLRNQPSVLIAFISAMITIIIALSKYAAYISNYKVLNYWNVSYDACYSDYIDDAWINVAKNAIIYVIMFAILILARSLITLTIRYSTSNKLAKIMSEIHSLDYIKEYPRKVTDNYQKAEDAIRTIELETKRYAKRNAIMVVALLIMYFFCNTQVGYPFDGLYLHVKESAVAVVTVTVISIIYAISGEIKTKEYMHSKNVIKAYRKTIDSCNEKEIINLCEDALICIYEVLSVIKMTRNYTDLIKANITIMICVILICMSGLLQVFNSAHLATSKESMKNEFYISSFGDSQYALIHVGKTINVFEKVSIQDESVVINTNEQLISTKAEQLELKLVKFEEVIKK